MAAIHNDMMKITKAQFNRYRKVQKSGKYNMMAESMNARYEANLERDQYFTIIKNYSALAEKYGPYKE